MESFSRLVYKKRQEKGYSMRTLSKLLDEREGIKASRTVINFVEKGIRPPTFELAYGLSKVLDMDVTETLRGAFLARAEYNLRREREYLGKLIQEKDLRGVNVEEIVSA